MVQHHGVLVMVMSRGKNNRIGMAVALSWHGGSALL